MTEPAFVDEAEIATTPERLWAALTSGQLTRGYWMDRRIESDWTVGSEVHFYDGASDVVTDSGVVLECDPPRRRGATSDRRRAFGSAEILGLEPRRDRRPLAR